MISVILVWRVNDTFKAALSVEDCTQLFWKLTILVFQVNCPDIFILGSLVASLSIFKAIQFQFWSINNQFQVQAFFKYNKGFVLPLLVLIIYELIHNELL
jgi:hypothetical protein